MTPEREKEIRAILQGHAAPIAHIAYELLVENDRLRRIIAKELSENDDLGTEFTYVCALKEENRQIREKLSVAEEALSVSEGKRKFLLENFYEEKHETSMKIHSLERSLDIAMGALEKFANAKRRTVFDILPGGHGIPVGVLMLEIDNEIADEALAEIRGEE